MEEQVISIEEIIDSLKKRWKLIAAITIIATLASGIFSFFLITPQYEASTKLFIGKEEGENQTYNQSDIMLYQQLLKTYSEAIKTKDLIEDAISDVNTELKSESILNNLSVLPVADTQILQIKYTGENPEEVNEILINITDEFIKVSKELVPNGNIRVIEKSEVPENPVSANKVMNIAIAFLLGLMVSIGLCFLLEFLDNTYKTKEQLEKDLELPVIGTIPSMDNN